MTTKGIPSTSVSWREVGLATLPGLIMVCTAFFGPTRSPLPSLFMLSGIGLLAMFGSVRGLSLWSLPALGVFLTFASLIGSWWLLTDLPNSWPFALLILGAGGLVAILSLVRRLPLWSLPALGFFLGFSSLPAIFVCGLLWLAFIGAGVILQRRGLHIPAAGWVLPILMAAMGIADCAVSVTTNEGLNMLGSLWASLARPAVVLVPVAIGLLLARRIGLQAALLVVAAETILVEWLAEPTYGLWRYPLGRAVSAALWAPMLICPIWVLLARSERVQKWGVLLPWGMTLATMVIVPDTLRSDSWALWVRHTAWAVEFFLGMVLAVVLYSRFWQKSASVETESVEGKAANIAPTSVTT